MESILIINTNSKMTFAFYEEKLWVSAKIISKAIGTVRMMLLSTTRTLVIPGSGKDDGVYYLWDEFYEILPDDLKPRALSQKENVLSQVAAQHRVQADKSGAGSAPESLPAK